MATTATAQFPATAPAPAPVRPDDASTVPEMVERRRQLVNEAGEVVGGVVEERYMRGRLIGKVRARLTRNRAPNAHVAAVGW
jgi:hypothetical protein